jgi:hypothetical protein
MTDISPNIFTVQTIPNVYTFANLRSTFYKVHNSISCAQCLAVTPFCLRTVEQNARTFIGLVIVGTDRLICHRM